jgi:succinoglycan biosynthesis protein ExoM
MHIAICVATFNRPRLLENLLSGIAELRFPKAGVPEITVIVVDNDASGTAKNGCRKAAFPWRLQYVREPKRGIAEARNRALKEIGDADFLAFIDDDEVPGTLWLDELLSAQANFHSDVVAGPVFPSFTEEVPEWIREAGFFVRPAHLTGDSLAYCSTGNALVARNVFDRVGGFDDRFQFTGGEDLQFFTRVRLAGFNIVWSREAVVIETVSSDRANLGSLLRRAYTGGNSYALVESSLDGRAYLRFMRFMKACARILEGSLKACASLLTGRVVTAVRALRSICSGVGMLTGLSGLRNESYKTVRGDPVEAFVGAEPVIVAPEIQVFSGSNRRPDHNTGGMGLDDTSSSQMD